MKVKLKSALCILLCVFVALSLVQAAGATEISVAPLNPDYIQYISEEQNTAAETALTNADSPNASKQQFTSGLIPAPSTPVWPSGEQGASMDTICADAEPLPSYYNLHDEDRVTPVREQGKCGSCWAFATYGSLESWLRTDTEVAWDFSENNMNNLCSNLYPDGFDWVPATEGMPICPLHIFPAGAAP